MERGAGEMAQWLRKHSALVEDLNLDLSNDRQLTTNCDPYSRGPYESGLLSHLYLYTYTHEQTI